MTDWEVATNVNNATLEMLVSPVMTVAVPIIYLLVFVCSTPLNLLSLLMLLKIYYKRHTPTSVFAINMSLADLIYSVFLPLQVLYHRQGNDWTWSATLCRITTNVHYCNIHCSILTTCAIAVNRYCGVVHPLRTRHWCTARRATAVCVVIWALVLVGQTPFLRSNLKLRIIELNISTCFDVIPRKVFHEGLDESLFLSILYIGTLCVLFYLIPFIILVSAYVAISRVLRRSPSKETTYKGEKQEFSRRQSQTVIAIATVCFVVCYLPTIILQPIQLVFFPKGKSLYAYYKLTVAINSFNCCFDPFVYYFASREFRQALKASLRAALTRWCGWWCGCCAPLIQEENRGNQELAAVNKEV